MLSSPTKHWSPRLVYAARLKRLLADAKLEKAILWEAASSCRRVEPPEILSLKVATFKGAGHKPTRVWVWDFVFSENHQKPLGPV